MTNKKGQALVEFIIILPVIIYIILVLVDFMLIFSYRNNLESKMNDVITLYKDNRNINEYLNKDLKDVSYQIKSDDKYTYIVVKMNYKFITPGLNNVLGNKDVVKSERVILNG